MPEQQWIWRCDHVIPSDATAARRIIEEILEELEAHHWPRRDVFSIHLAIEEALLNAIHHGNRCDHLKQVQVSCRLSPQRVRIEIADQGKGFDPSTVPDPTDPERLERPGGRGVLLIKAFMSRVEYNATGNRVVLEKTRGGRR